MNAREEDVDHYHALFKAALLQLHENNRARFDEDSLVVLG
jgi:hypothetical protein